jgi:hypothetical protein
MPEVAMIPSLASIVHERNDAAFERVARRRPHVVVGAISSPA